ncbi:hypothetical protein RAN53_06745 [Halomonas sp. SSL-5]|uniref:hypothetical protein n=1 Tax=Halomonas sp. SSL-5 TaxID=3065855 RepID=UPI002739431D|nr:hypothetical protein [Halomonas sp. SSL-5]MDY7116042.1 hypothetical protein [Halomonas sp. SSL-5]
MSANNPASRLLKLIQDGQKQKKDQQAFDAWAAILDVPKDDKSLLLSRVGHVMALPGAIKAEIEQVDNINHQLHLKWLPSVETSFGILNLQVQWKQFIERFNAETIFGLEVCGDVLGRNRPERVVDPASLKNMLNDINDLIGDLKEDELPPDLRDFIFEHLVLVKNAVEEYKIRGGRPLEAEVERLTGAVARNPQVWIRTRETDLGKRFWQVMGNLAIVTTVFVGQLQIGHEIFDALSPDDGKLQTVQPDVEVNVNMLTSDCDADEITSEVPAKPALPYGHGKT